MIFQIDDVPDWQLRQEIARWERYAGLHSFAEALVSTFQEELNRREDQQRTEHATRLLASKTPSRSLNPDGADESAKKQAFTVGETHLGF